MRPAGGQSQAKSPISTGFLWDLPQISHIYWLFQASMAKSPDDPGLFGPDFSM
jgi:hypothetical protein